MKNIPILLLVLILAICLATGCNNRPEPVEESSEEQSSSQSSSQPRNIPEIRNYTVSEAASQNAKIKDSDVNLVQFDPPAESAKKAVIKTNLGDIEVILFDKQAPLAVENFIYHANDGYYSGLAFDKILNNFIIEGGDVDGKGGQSSFIGGDGKPENFEIEPSLDLWHFRGAVSMSITEGQKGNASRFFIVQAPFVDEETKELMREIGYPDKVLERYEEVGGTPGFDSKRTVFGMVTPESLPVVDAIAALRVDEDGEPVEDVIYIETVIIVSAD